MPHYLALAGYVPPNGKCSWSELFPAEQARIVQLLVERVDLQEDALEVQIRAEGIKATRAGV